MVLYMRSLLTKLHESNRVSHLSVEYEKSHHECQKLEMDLSTWHLSNATRCVGQQRPDRPRYGLRRQVSRMIVPNTGVYGKTLCLSLTRRGASAFVFPSFSLPLSSSTPIGDPGVCFCFQ